MERHEVMDKRKRAVELSHDRLEEAEPVLSRFAGSQQRRSGEGNFHVGDGLRGRQGMEE